MERLRPIEEIERDFRRSGSFLLVMNGKLQFYGRKLDTRAILVKEIAPRTAEMINFLKAQVVPKGEYI